VRERALVNLVVMSAVLTNPIKTGIGTKLMTENLTA
jgi:hypothetical protein